MLSCSSSLLVCGLMVSILFRAKRISHDEQVEKCLIFAGCDKRLTIISLLGSQGVEYPERFFARDYAGNRLEFSI